MLRLPTFRFRAAGSVGGLLALLLLPGAQACEKKSDGVTISGDVAGLDSIGLRGDSLIARADRMPSTIDSLRAIAEGKVPRPRVVAGTKGDSAAPKAPVTNPIVGGTGASITLRAQARGDSMARAAALRLVYGNSSGRSRGDTVRGVVTLIGAEPAKQVVLRTVDGSRTIAMSGMVTTGLSRLAGVELMVRGVMITPLDIVVSEFVVRAANGVPAFDGKLASDGNGSFLQLTDGSGRKRIGALPSPLQGLDGTRVWIALKPGARSATAYGVIGRR
ncbi:MAG: hypothetical protein IPP90_20375 [Gemmatimonadaceae bacterium]|nr:hypothetical protein [Gemmatimonadaceae bacterium]